jgi:hypothetical protein
MSSRSRWPGTERVGRPSGSAARAGRPPERSPAGGGRALAPLKDQGSERAAARARLTTRCGGSTGSRPLERALPACPTAARMGRVSNGLGGSAGRAGPRGHGVAEHTVDERGACCAPETWPQSSPQQGARRHCNGGTSAGAARSAAVLSHLHCADAAGAAARRPVERATPRPPPGAPANAATAASPRVRAPPCALHREQPAVIWLRAGK